MAVVTFDHSAFQARYPEFSTIQQSTLQAYFDEAGTLYIDNSNASVVGDTVMRGYLLNLATAHLAALYSGVNGESPQEGVGRVDQATEGSVSVHLDMGAVPGTDAWWMQTKYGAAFLQASAKYRTFRYSSAPVPVAGYQAPWRK